MRRIRSFLTLSSVSLLAACSSANPSANATTVADAAPAEAAPVDPASELSALRAKIEQYAPVELSADVSSLPESERQALEKIIEASRLLDPIFDRQAWTGNPELEAKLAADDSEFGKAQLEYFEIMRGPWDRQDHFKPFIDGLKHPEGAGFYPEDLTADEFRKYLEAHPDQRPALENLATVIERDGEKLVAVPYSKVYGQWLEPAAKKLEEAAALTKNESLQAFLNARAAAFRSDDYYESDKAWMDLDSRVEVTIGPYETYEDELMGLKASFEAFVTVSDPAASEKLSVYKGLLPEMEEHLPVPAEVKNKRGAESPIRVVDIVYTSGDARKSVQTIAFNLPNDERVRKEKGAKKVMLRNAINVKFDRIMKPIAEKVIAGDQLQYLSQDAFFNETLFHELSHSLGPAFVGNDEKKGEVRIALGASYSALEEAKADVMGAYNVLFMIEKGLFPKDFREKILLSYFAGLFRSVRFGVAEAHGMGAAFQINRFVEEGAANFDEASATFKVDMDKLEASVGKLVGDICMMQHHGDKAAVDATLDKYGKVSPPMAAALAKLEGIPVDIRPSYPVAGE